MLEAVKIIAFALLAAITYGILHDQVTAHICVEYFTIAHPPIFPTNSPFWLAIGWGIIATWWVGLPFGIALAFVARSGQRAKLGFDELKVPIMRLMGASGLVALLSGVVGAVLVSFGQIWPIGEWADAIPRSKWPQFGFDLWAHSASYGTGAFGGTFLIARTVVLRRRMSSQS